MDSHIIFDKVKPFTLTGYERVHAITTTIDSLTDQITGDIVECGVWKGGSMMAVALWLKHIGDTSRNLYLFDTFQGMTPPTAVDIDYLGRLPSAYSNDFWKSVAVSLEEVQQNMFSTGYPKDKIHFVVGKVEDTLPKNAPANIAILRLDTDWYESTLHELTHLYPRLVDGGTLLVDDYGHWAGAKQAVHEYFGDNVAFTKVDYTCIALIKNAHNGPSDRKSAIL